MRKRLSRTKIVVIGGSGLIGTKVVAASPDSGVNTITGEGLKLVAIGLICAAVSLTAHKATAQQHDRFAQCRSQAAAQGIDGDAYGDFLEKCMPQSASAAASPQDRFASCQQQARTTAGRGEAYGKALDRCMAGPSGSGAPSTAATYADCRAQAISQGAASGARLAAFIDRCVGK
jgi:hypothetical protein